MEIDMYPAANRFALPHLELPPWARWLRDRVQAPAWLVPLAAVALLALMMAFVQVVRGAVAQGELRRQANATHAVATWRCNGLTGQGASGACLSRLRAAPVASAQLRSDR